MLGYCPLSRTPIERMKACMGIDIGKKRCDYCIVGGDRKVLDRNLLLDVYGSEAASIY